MAAVVPVKGLDAAKSRLSPAYPFEFRRGLALAMLEDVLSALCSVRELSELIVVTAAGDKWIDVQLPDGTTKRLAQKPKA